MAREFRGDDVRIRRVISDLLSGMQIEEMRDDELSLVLWDVAQAATIFRAEADWLEYHGVDGVPVVRLGDEGEIPVSLRTLGVPPDLAWPFSRYFRLNTFFSSVSDRGGVSGALRMVGREEASTNFLEAAIRSTLIRWRFLQIWGLGEAPSNGDDGGVTTLPGPTHWFTGGPPPGTAGGVPTLRFKVSTKTSNLRVFWSGAYFLNPNYFGHPTSPAVAPLQAGTYVFGVDGGLYGSTVQWDLVAVCSVPNVNAVHLSY